MNTKIKEAFKKAKQDVFYLGKQVNELKLELFNIKEQLNNITKTLENNKNSSENIKKNTPTHITKNPTIQHINPTHLENPTDDYPLEALKQQNMEVSTGNGGVPTDRQTDRQTDIRHINKEKSVKKDKIEHLSKASEILNNLDGLKKEVRKKFKQLTSQEMAIFSLIYQLDSQGELVDYSLLSRKMNLSQGSIRDYIHKITRKAILIEKEKVNNKKIIFHIPLELRKIASLDTIIKLREL